MSLSEVKNSSANGKKLSLKSKNEKKHRQEQSKKTPETVEELLQSLGVGPDDLRRCPPITEMLKSARGGLKAVLKAMRFSVEDGDISRFLGAYDALPETLAPAVPWEAICIVAEVNPKHLLGAAQVAIGTYFSHKSRIIAVSSHPSIARARVKYGRMASGEKDRNALDIMVGALPSAKGPTFIGKAVFGGSAAASATSDEDDDDNEGQTQPIMIGSEDDVDNVFPPASAIQEKLVPIRNRLLEGGKG
ncbi:MAG TPA: hypothetical protein VFW94_23360 [Candidatus Acidoferrales bacterium]|nr:hypothetical protein [Candidatus Acidoferrales bacterium]